VNRTKYLWTMIGTRCTRQSGAIARLMSNVRRMHGTQTFAALNRFGVDLLPESYNRVLFDKVACSPVCLDTVESSLNELDKFGLTSGSSEVPVPEIENVLPPLKGRNVIEHFHNVSKEQTDPYVDILKPLLEVSADKIPADLRIEAGWTRYGFDGSVCNVDHPREPAFIFDVEVSVKTDMRAVMAACVSDKAWYTWLSPYFLSTSHSFPSDITPDTMIPLGSHSNSSKLVIGHNISYDRIRIGDEYNLKRSGTRYLDTMSLHIAYCGMTSSQRMLKMAENKIEKSSRPKWLERTCLNNLADIHEHYCKPDVKMSKDVRNSFVVDDISTLRENIAELLAYCVSDVAATLQVVQVLVPKFLQSCKNRATLSGMLTMSTSFLPTNSAWEKYLCSADIEFDKMKSEMQSMLEKEVWSALQLYKNHQYANDPWLWDLNWKAASLRSKKRKLLESLTNDTETTSYPAWLQELVSQTEQGEPFLDITPSKRIVPKVLRLTWKGFPIHHHAEHKWGYLVPRKDIQQVLEMVKVGDINTSFPLQEYYNSISSHSTAGFKDVTEIFIDQVPDFSDKNVLQSKKSVIDDPNPKDGIDIGIPGVIFHKLPHKNGPKYNVGNPLSKDFLSACSEGGALASKRKDLALNLLNSNSQMVYWRNTRARLMEQLKVDHPEGGYSAILPNLVVSGTVTRRAVEKTWLTASNAKENRIGSELKTAIRSPPGYHFVGADVDSQELWLASVLGDSERGGHGSTPLGWMSLQGEKGKGTDLHSKTAAAAQVSRDQAKVLNYARIYGAGEPFARLLLQQFNPALSEKEAAGRAKHMYEQTKGLRGYMLNEKGKRLYELFYPEKRYTGQMISKKMMNILTKKMGFLNKIVKESKYVTYKDQVVLAHVLTEEGKCLFLEFSSLSDIGNKSVLLDDKKLRKFYDYLVNKFGDTSLADFKVMESLVHQTIWFGGSESHTFNKLEAIAMSEYPQTPVLGALVSRALDTKLIGRNFLPSRINWVVQSTAVDFLHLLIVSMEWLMKEFNIEGRYSISIHDEVRFLVKSEDRYKAALALHLSNLLVRSHVVASLGLNNLPASIAFFSSVDVDTTLRKEPTSDCKTPSNPLGLEAGHGIPPGEGLDIFQTINKIS